MDLFTFHPESPDVKLLVFNSATRDFSSWQVNQGVARRRTQVRRTSKPADCHSKGGKVPFPDENYLASQGCNGLRM
jgi:hypothetical protein